VPFIDSFIWEYNVAFFCSDFTKNYSIMVASFIHVPFLISSAYPTGVAHRRAKAYYDYFLRE
jgi:hypothetical protein